jgi:subtilase family serine protease
MEEADLDIEWAGAVARNATIIYVNSAVGLVSAGYAITEQLAPVVSMSFGACEVTQPANRNTFRSWVQQGNAQGITTIAASGDLGAAGCDQKGTSFATGGLAVQFPASIPEVTAVGGTEFVDEGGNYWNAANSSTGGSALSYIPETAWNDAGVNGATGGGFSAFYPQPSWQVGPGLMAPNARAVPDVSLAASALHDGYIIFSGGQLVYPPVGGTSAAAPVFAGMIALLNQYEGSSGHGNINQNLYRLAQTNIFNDIKTGSNVVPCVVGTPNCESGSFGYYAGIGYDPVTGLGSVDAYNLVTEWNAATPVSQVIVTCNPNPVNQ